MRKIIATLLLSSSLSVIAGSSFAQLISPTNQCFYENGKGGCIPPTRPIIDTSRYPNCSEAGPKYMYISNHSKYDIRIMPNDACIKSGETFINKLASETRVVEYKNCNTNFVEKFYLRNELPGVGVIGNVPQGSIVYGGSGYDNNNGVSYCGSITITDSF